MEHIVNLQLFLIVEALIDILGEDKQTIKIPAQNPCALAHRSSFLIFFKFRPHFCSFRKITDCAKREDSLVKNHS